jgi:hypothetical protein
MRPAMLPVSHLGEKQQLHDLACERQTDGRANEFTDGHANNETGDHLSLW